MVTDSCVTQTCTDSTGLICGGDSAKCATYNGKCSSIPTPTSRTGAIVGSIIGVIVLIIIIIVTVLLIRKYKSKVNNVIKPLS